jgi:adenylate cyclase
MVEVIHRHGGTIDEIIGDAILVIFGAPMAMLDAAQRAVYCALEMQKAMQEVNDYSFQKGWPEIEMGIALHTGEAVVGNIGSTKRSKYGVIGQPVNLTARIESFTVGGQVLVSPTLIDAAGQGLILGDEVEVHAKGMREALKCRDLLGHKDYPDLMLEKEEESILTPLAPPMPCHYLVLSGKRLDGPMQPAALVSISRRRAVIEVNCKLPRRTNLMMRLERQSSEENPPEIYAKVIKSFDRSTWRYLIHFTSVPPALQELLQRLTDEAKGL